jgi:hypothetical protein
MEGFFKSGDRRGIKGSGNFKELSCHGGIPGFSSMVCCDCRAGLLKDAAVGINLESPRSFINVFFCQEGCCELY